MTQRVVVTGGSGKAGRGVVRDLHERGYEVLNVDVRTSPESSGPDAAIPLLHADLTDYGQALEALGVGDWGPAPDAIVHLAAIPSSVHTTPDQVFRTNVTSTYTVFSAAARLGIKRVVWASSTTTLGMPFERTPDYAPLDETHIYPESGYALSKVLGEAMARQFSRKFGMTILGLRFANVMVRTDYEEFPTFWDNPQTRRRDFWGYVDESHVNQSVRLGLESNLHGADNFIIAAADTVMRLPSREIMSEVYPDIPVAEGLSGCASLLSIDKARAALGYRPEFTWRELF